MTGPEVLGSLGIGVAANAIWAYLSRLQGKPKEVATRDLQAFLVVQGVTVSASAVLSALASKGLLTISDSLLVARDDVSLRAAPGAVLHVGGRTEAHNTGTGAHLNTGVDGSIIGSDANVRLAPNGDAVLQAGSSDLVVSAGSTDFVLAAGRRR